MAHQTSQTKVFIMASKNSETMKVQTKTMSQDTTLKYHKIRLRGSPKPNTDGAYCYNTHFTEDDVFFFGQKSADWLHYFALFTAWRIY